MIRAVLISFLLGVLIGAGSTVWFAYIVLNDVSVSVAGMEKDLHRVSTNFDLGLKMVADATPEAAAQARHISAEARRSSPKPRVASPTEGLYRQPQVFGSQQTPARPMHAR